MILGLSLKIFLREFKSGQLNTMLLSLTLAVTIVSGIALFTDRLEQALKLESEEFLGGNLKFETNEPLKKEVLDRINPDLASTDMILFASVLFSDEEMQLSSIKAVDSNYPLVGKIELIKKEGIVTEKSSPASGEVWIDSRLKTLLDIELNDYVSIGDNDFVFTAIINYEPDRGSSSFAFAPKAIINSNDLKSTNIIQPGSRVRYAYLFIGEDEDINALNSLFEEVQKEGDQITLLGDDSSSLGRAIDRSGNFFLLGGLIAVLLSACTVGISSQRFTRRHVNYVGILRSLGMSSKDLKSLYVLLFLIIASFSLLLGLTLGWLVQSNFVELMKSYFPSKLPPAGLYPLYISSLTVIICQLGFVYPHVIKLLEITPLEVLRKDQINLNQKLYTVLLMALLAFFMLLYLYTNEIVLSGIIFLGIFTFSIIGLGLIYLFFGNSSTLGLGAQSPFSLAFSELRRRKLSNSFQVLAFMIAIGLSLITYSSSNDLLKSWENSVPENSPNNFAINITAKEIDPIKKYLSENQIQSEPFYPITNTRMFRDSADETKRPIERTFNMTWINELPKQNEIISGEWFSEKSNNGVSISQEISERYDLKIGEKITINFQEKDINTYIQSIRGVNWDNFSPNFFLIGSPDIFHNNSATYITSFYIPKDQKKVASGLIRNFRTVSIFSIEAIIEQITDIIDQVSKALTIILALTILSAFFLAFSALQDGFQIRVHQAAVLRTLGASRDLIRKATLIEFSLLGLLSGILATGMAQTGIYFIETQVFEVSPKLHINIWFIGPLMGLTIVSLLCLYLNYSQMKKSPKNLLFEV